MLVLSKNIERKRGINAWQNRWEGKRGRGRRRGRKSTSNHKFNLVSILMSTELKCQQKCSHTWKTFNAFWTLFFFSSLFSQIHLIHQMREVCRRLRNGTILSSRQLKFGEVIRTHLHPPPHRHLSSSWQQFSLPFPPLNPLLFCLSASSSSSSSFSSSPSSLLTSLFFTGWSLCI